MREEHVVPRRSAPPPDDEMETATIGFPRVGARRELKFALESYWKGNSNEKELLDVLHGVEQQAWNVQRKKGVDRIGLDGTLYDQVLDWIFYLGLAPERFGHLQGFEQYFAMARGTTGAPALDMSKWFDTNYHYLVPELDANTRPSLENLQTFLDKVLRGQQTVGKKHAVPLVIGPITLVHMGKLSGVTSKDVLNKLLPAYARMLKCLKDMDVVEVQIDEPFLCKSAAGTCKEELQWTYETLSKEGVPINLCTYYDDVCQGVYQTLVGLPVGKVSLDFCGVPGALEPPCTLDLIKTCGFPSDKKLGAGVIDGRSVWAEDGAAARTLDKLVSLGVSKEKIVVQPSCPLLHVPYDVEMETLPPALQGRLSFAVQKLDELVGLASGRAAQALTEQKATKTRSSAGSLDPGMFSRSMPFEERRKLQPPNPKFPTTTIGSFPQTQEIRRLRFALKKGRISEEEYNKLIDQQIAHAIGVQDGLGLDVLVHGEAERTDMVEFFGQQLDGFLHTQHGWVQSYGSRCVRPPIIYGDVSRPAPMTVREFKVAQALTSKPVKGMLTGPVTILNWSFPRKDISRKEQAFQLAMSLRAEVDDLQANGCVCLQMDDPALREGLPLKQERWAQYLEWAVQAFRLATAVAKPEVQIVTHLCYSDFGDILEAIDGMQADVLTIENSRSGDEMIKCLAKYGYNRDLGAGVYDVHSPVVPSANDIVSRIEMMIATGLLKGHHDRIWINPDCGLKTRQWEEVIPSLRNSVMAATMLRERVG